MDSKNRWLFEIYFVVILIFSALKVHRLFAMESPEYLFYFLLRSFDAKFYLVYTAHVLYVALNVIHCIPLFCAIYRIRFVHPHFWKVLFLLRCIFEFTGQTYQANVISALYQANSVMLYWLLAIVIVPLIPSYVLCFMYAFRQDKLFKRSS